MEWVTKNAVMAWLITKRKAGDGKNHISAVPLTFDYKGKQLPGASHPDWKEVLEDKIMQGE